MISLFYVIILKILLMDLMGIVIYFMIFIKIVIYFIYAPIYHRIGYLTIILNDRGYCTQNLKIANS